MDELSNWKQRIKIAMDELIAAEADAHAALNDAYAAMTNGDGKQTDDLIAEWRRLEKIREEKKTEFARAHAG